MFNPIKKLFSSKKNTKHNIGEELTEKQTTKGGYFLLVLMFFAIISTGQWTINIIQNIPDSPTKVPNCIERIVNTFEKENSYSYYKTCSDNSLVSAKPKFDFTNEYNALENDYKKLIDIKKDINNYENQIFKLEKEIGDIQNNYNTSLTEDIANEENKIYNKGTIQYKLQKNYKELESLNKNLKNKENQVTSLISKNSSYINNLKEKIESVEKEYDRLYLMYRIYIAVLSFIFAITVFLIVYKIYSKLKRENSPYSIIFSVASFAYGLLLLQITIWFLWDIIPKKFAQFIIEFLSAFKPAIYLLQFLWPVLIVGIFGFIVYKIQKRLYSKENIIKRFIADKKCPNCGNEVDIKKPYCPLCSNKIQIKCPHCKELTIKGMPYCSNCGKDLEN